MGSLAEMTLWQHLHHIDQDVTLAVNSFSTPVSDFLWQCFSDKEIWFVLYAVVLFFFFRKLGWKKALVVTIATVLIIVVCDQFANFTKEAVGRLRPCWDIRMVNGGLNMLEGKGNYFGFYSAHAANAMGFAVCSAYAFRRIGGCRSGYYSVSVIVWAILVGMSRVFVGKHFFGDVLVGFAVGACVSLLMSSAASALVRRLNL